MRVTKLLAMMLLASVVAGAGEAPPPTVPVAVPGTPIQTGAPQQVSVSVKIVEFQATKGVETGMSAFFARRNEVRPYGRVSSGNGAITTADLTFPLSSEGAITVFLDRLRLNEGDLEILLQALVNENRALILSRPKAMVMVRSGTPTIIKTVEENPYESPTVVGTTVVTATKFRPTGVTLTVHVPDVVDDDLNWNTTQDTYINLNLLAEVKELGEDIIVALDNRIVGASRIAAPTFVTRSINTSVWVRHGQVLILGGLFRNRKIKNLDTVPGLSKVEEFATGLASKVIPGDVGGTPVTSSLGNRESEEQRRELVFFIKAETWRPAYTVADEQGIDGASQEDAEGKDGKDRMKPTEVIGDVIGGITSIPQGIAEGVTGEKSDEKTNVESQLGGPPK
ncbi:MAG: type II and III secretion system protein [Candidatus Hydrogenedentes bacterium]|nr:type II and III secretion system protein [Candidatus Hydrogenedentota bacterium]